MRILFAFDGSAEAFRALGYAERLHEEDSVTIISVVPALLEAPRTAEFTDPTAEPQRLRSEIEEARRAVADHGIDVEAVVAVGNPAEEILNAAEAGGVELIVMGRRGRNAIARFVMGSVSDRVVRHATCDVLVVR